MLGLGTRDLPANFDGSRALWRPGDRRMREQAFYDQRAIHRFMNPDEEIERLCEQYGTTPAKVLFRFMTDDMLDTELRIKCATAIERMRTEAIKVRQAEEAPQTEEQQVTYFRLPDNGRRPDASRN